MRQATATAILELAAAVAADRTSQQPTVMTLHNTAAHFRVVLTVRNGVMEWVMGLGHISAAYHATSGGASRIRHRPPSRMTQSRLRIVQNTCGVTDWCVSHSTHPDPRKRNITIK